MAASLTATGVPAWVPLFNPIALFLLAAGVPLGPNALITIRGRKSRLPHTTPVTVVAGADRRWLTAPLSEVDWLRNLRRAGRATMTVRRRTVDVTAVELGPTERDRFLSRCPCSARSQVDRVDDSSVYLLVNRDEVSGLAH